MFRQNNFISNFPISPIAYGLLKLTLFFVILHNHT